jgi:hypothetical protein
MKFVASRDRARSDANSTVAHVALPFWQVPIERLHHARSRACCLACGGVTLEKFSNFF